MEQEYGTYDRILDLIPDGILAVDGDLGITAINRAARRFLGAAEETGLKGSPVSAIMDESGFARLRDGRNAHFIDEVSSQPGRRLERTFLGDREHAVYLCLMRDVTELCEQQELLRKRERRAAELAEAMNEKHLRLVQEVAGLLGEDAADMQIALRELKNAIRPDEGKKHA
ncbi:MAG: PAS domain-containing protein [Oscillospiraceae bacterium]|nr:PAS domain-containing protein [Oscillospiraceae bacterium]